MNELVIEKGIPIPPDPVLEAKRQLLRMEIGDSVYFRYPAKYKTRSAYDENGTRVWRVE
jgi:hypothetical protein